MAIADLSCNFITVKECQSCHELQESDHPPFIEKPALFQGIEIVYSPFITEGGKGLSCVEYGTVLNISEEEWKEKS